MKKKNKLISVIFFVMTLLTITGCGSKTKSGLSLKMGTGEEDGNYYNYGTNLAQEVAEQSDYNIEVLSTNGSVANLRLISEGYVDIAIVQSDAMADALSGLGDFSQGALSGFHVLAGLYTEQCQVVVSADSDIESIKDLKGKRVSIGAEDSGVVKNAEDILASYGLNRRNIQSYNLDFAESAKALQNGDIDAFFCTASVPTYAISQLADQMDIRILSFPNLVIERLVAESDGYLGSMIEADSYKGQIEPIILPGVSALLVASDNLDGAAEKLILDVLKADKGDLKKFNITPKIAEEEDAVQPQVVRFNLNFDMYQTLAIAVVFLFLGILLRKKVPVLDKFCIPAPVIGGLIFAILSFVLYSSGVVEFNFDETLKNVCMIMFFTSVGFQANVKVLKSGGISLLVFLVGVIALIIIQNLTGIGLASLLHLDPFIGMCTGSIPMVGGHGTAGAFGQVLEDLGVTGATTICTAAATFGLVAGSLMGGPLGRKLILKNNLLDKVKEDASVVSEKTEEKRNAVSKYAPAVYQIAIAMGIGTVVSYLLSKTGMTFPVYIGAMIIAAVMRNISELSGKFEICMDEINDIGSICLSLFLGIAMITLKLWQLSSLALPLFVLLLGQTILMFLFAYFVVFNIMGRDYDAAVLAAGTCGFGLGATPNAMANMQALTEKYAPSVKAYILVPIVGSMFADFINSLVITIILNML